MTLSLVMYVVLYLVGSETMGLFADLARMINVESRIHRIIRPEAREHCAYKECAGHVIAFDEIFRQTSRHERVEEHGTRTSSAVYGSMDLCK